MNSDQILAFWILLIVLMVVLPFLYWRSEQQFKDYLVSQLHPTELYRMRSSDADTYIGTVYSDGYYYDIYANGKGGFHYKKEVEYHV